MKPAYVFIFLACILLSCNTIKSIAVKEGNFPLIGAIGKEKGTLLKTQFIQIGHPILETPIALSVQSIAFTSKSFKDYNDMKEQGVSENTVHFVDSLEFKPTYITLAIKDRIGLKKALNSELNEDTKSYLEKDASSRLVSEIAVVLDKATETILSDADGIFLITDKEGLLWIEAIHDKQRHKINIPASEIFDYKLMGVCWGKNTVGKTVVETFNDNGRCPKGTQRNARKLDDTFSFLKL